MANRPKKLRILLTLESYPPQITGSGIATKRLAEGLSGRGHHVEVVCPGNSLGYVKTLEDRVVVHRVSSMAIPFHREFRCSFFPASRMGKIFDEAGPEILHIVDHLFVSRAAYRMARKKGVKVIGTNHFTPYNWIPNLGIKDRPVLHRAVEKILWGHFAALFRKLDVIITSTEVAGAIIRNAGIKKQIIIISNGIDLNRFSEVSPQKEVLKKYNIDPADNIILSVSRLDNEKRVDLLIGALSLIKDEAPFKAVITGKGNAVNDLEKMVDDSGLNDRVIFTGVVDEDIMDMFFKVSDIFVTASEVELQGLSIMEAMAAGLPVVAARSMAIPELVRDGYNGYLFEPGDAGEAGRKILKLLNNRNIKGRMSDNSLRAIKDHDFEKVLDSIEDIYYRNI